MAKKNPALRRKSRVPAAVRRQRKIMERVHNPRKYEAPPKGKTPTKPPGG